MKKSALIFVIVGCAFGVVAQQRVETAAEEPEGYEYVPLVREGVEWGYEWLYGYYGIEGRFRITMSGNATIDGNDYVKCYRSAYLNVDEDRDLVGYVREEDRKVYCILLREPTGHVVEQPTEMLLYDFNADVGDVYNGDPQNMEDANRVASVDYVKVAGKYRKRITGYGGLEIVEGLGPVSSGHHGDLLSPTDAFMSCSVCFRGTLSYVRAVEDLYNGNPDRFEYDARVDSFSGINKTEADDYGLQVSQGDGWLRVGVDCDCYRRAELADAKGAVVDAVELSGESEAVLSTAGLSPGVYVVSLVSDTAVRSAKVLIK